MRHRPVALSAAPAGSSSRWRPGSLRAPAAPARDRVGRWLSFLCLTLLGYALFGKGWAYLGVPPVYVGEVALASGGVAYLAAGHWGRTLRPAPVRFLLALAAWGTLRTWPYLSLYGIDAVRDAATWGYGAFAVMVFGCIAARPSRLAGLLGRYERFATIFPPVIPAIWVVRRFFEETVPRWPWADVPVIDAKGGDMLVHLSGILAFWVAGLGRGAGRRQVVVLGCCVALMGTFDRAGLLSFLAAFGVCFFLRPHDRSLWRLIAVGSAGLLILAATNIHVEMPGREREVSFEQVVENVTSIVGSSGTGDLDDTKRWRLEWWGTIVDYTIRGEYFWTGKGFGINLADDDGFQGTDWKGLLRSPHNGHLTILARAGVPGLVLWGLVQLSWAYGIVAGYLTCRMRREGRWAGLFLFLLVYWMAFMINTSFDVFIEGPMGGIWFWTIYGIGLAAMWVHQHCPEALVSP